MDEKTNKKSYEDVDVAMVRIVERKNLSNAHVIYLGQAIGTSAHNGREFLVSLAIGNGALMVTVGERTFMVLPGDMVAAVAARLEAEASTPKLNSER